MSEPILPLAVWQSGTNEASIPANDNALRLEILNGLILSDVTAAQPGSPADGDIYIIPSGATGAQWSSFDENDLTIFSDGNWYAYAPAPGIVVNVDGTLKAWDADTSAYVDIGGGGGGGSTVGRQSIYVAAAGMRPSVSGGCAALALSAGASGQPDIATLDFDPTTQEYAQFALALPKKWNEGTITFRPYWSHAATTTNFGVVWSLQAVAVSDDDPLAANFGTAQTSSDTGGTTGDLYHGPESSAITVGGTPAAEDMVFFRVSRVTGDGGDTMAIDARLHGLMVYVTTDADTDA
jgi:hypothetical protein